MKKIAIHSVPRSGSTWLANIFNSSPRVSFSYQPLFSYVFKDFLNSNSSLLEINSFFKSISESDDKFLKQKEGIDKGIIPNFKKDKKITHVFYKEVRYHYILANMLAKSKDIKFIFIIRNPLNVLYSWYKAPKEFRSDKGWKLEEEWLHASKKNLNRPEEFNGYLKWKEAAHLFLELKEKYPEQINIITYEELIQKTVATVEKLFDFVELEFHDQTKEFIQKSKSRNDENPYSVFKVVKSDEKWKDLPTQIIDYIQNDLKGTRLEHFLV